MEDEENAQECLEKWNPHIVDLKKGVCGCFVPNFAALFLSGDARNDVSATQSSI